MLSPIRESLLTDAAADEHATPQQWELLASPGHVLLAQMQALATSKPTRLLKVIALFAALGALASLFVPGIAASMTDTATKKTVSGLSRMLAPEPPPALAQLTVPAAVHELAGNVERVRQLTPAADAQTWISDSIKRLNAGQQPEFCAAGNHKITESWAVGDGSEPVCRVGKHGVWVWAVVKQGDENYPQAVPLVGVFRKGPDAKTYAFWTLAEGGVRWPNRSSISLNLVPRAAAEDLPELLLQRKE